MVVNNKSGFLRKFILLIVVCSLYFVQSVLAGSIVSWGNTTFDSSQLDTNDFVAISAGDSHSLALKSDGSIVGWGADSYSQATPHEGNDFVAIAAGGGHSLALKSDGSVAGWGSNMDFTGDYHGQAISPDSNDFVAIAAGHFHSLALKSDGSIVGWGAGTEDLLEYPNYGIL